MTNKKVISVFIILVLVIVAIVLLSSRTPLASQKNSKIKIVSSFYPLTFIANAVGGNLVTVRNLVPAGVESHDFDPSSRDFIEIGNANVLLYNGAGFEPWIKKWGQGVSIHPAYVADMSRMLKEHGVSLIENNGATDPHFWLDPLVLKNEADIVRDLLAQVDPEHTDIFSQNAERLKGELDSLDQRIREGLSVCSIRDVIVLHKAFDYLAKQYGFRATSIEGISPEEEPSPKELARLIDLVRAKGVKYIFAETVASPKFSELIAREVGGTTLVLNPIESLTPDEVQWGEDYFSIMGKNLNNLKKAMICN